MGWRLTVSAGLGWLPWGGSVLLLQAPDRMADRFRRACACNLQVSRNADRIDMFLSHSWEDDATKKCAALRRFIESETAARGGKTPSLWFDKVSTATSIGTDVAGRLRAQGSLTDAGVLADLHRPGESGECAGRAPH